MRPELSRPVEWGQVEHPQNFTVEATPEERAALARRFGLQSLDRLVSVVTIYPQDKRGDVRMEGRLSADLVQTCVVTLDPVPAHVEDGFEETFTSDPERAGVTGEEEELDLSEIELPELLDGPMVDIGEVIAQYLALALDPYPRRSDADLPEAVKPSEAEEAERAPFAALEELRKRMN